jgi:hypothetical protein
MTKMKLFGQDDRRAQLQDLYRVAEEGEEAPAGVDPELQRAYAADVRIMRQLGRLADQGEPANPAIGRARLLAAVVQKRSQSPEKERRPMIGRLLTGRALALLATAGIFAGGAVTVGASGGVSGAAGNVNDVLATLHITDRTPDQADAHLDDIEQPDGSGKPSDVPPAEHGGGLSNAEQHADDNNTNAQHGLDNAAEGSDNAGQKIYNASQQGLDHANSHLLDEPPTDTGASDESHPAALPPQANEHASGGEDNGVAPPTHASEHAPEGAGEASGR